LRLLRGGRRHYFSLVSAAVLLVALTLAMTSGGFEAGDKSQPDPAEAAFATSTGPAPTGVQPPATANQTQVAIYYLVDSVDQIRAMQTVLRNDTFYLVQAGLPPMPPVERYFLLFDTPEDEAIGAHFLSQVTDSAALEGYTVHIVDMTR
jgi:hypothetical protein